MVLIKITSVGGEVHHTTATVIVHIYTHQVCGAYNAHCIHYIHIGYIDWYWNFVCSVYITVYCI